MASRMGLRVVALVGILDKVELAEMQTHQVGPLELLEQVALVVVEAEPIRSMTVGLRILMAAALVVALASLALGLMGLAEVHMATAAAVGLAALPEGIVLAALGQTAAATVAVAVVRTMSLTLMRKQSFPLQLAAMAGSALSVSSGVLAVAIRRTPQTSN